MAEDDTGGGDGGGWVETSLLVSNKDQGGTIIREYTTIRLALGAGGAAIEDAIAQAERQRWALWQKYQPTAVEADGGGIPAGESAPQDEPSSPLPPATAANGLSRPSGGGGAPAGARVPGGVPPKGHPYQVRIGFGKYSGKTIGDVLRMEPPSFGAPGKRSSYIEWLANEGKDASLRTACGEALACWRRGEYPVAEAGLFEDGEQIPF